MIHCPICQTPNPIDAKFCKECGHKLELICPNCGHENPHDAKFCNSCGQELRTGTTSETDTPVDKFSILLPEEFKTKLQTARSERTMAGERRVVTILFCDVKGSTAAAEQLDPEEWTEIMNGAFEYMIRPVYAYEGNVARLLGDAVLAFFGAPIMHEDDPQRAVLAGLDIVQGIQEYRENIRREWGINFDVRVGINTGLVVVGEVGSDLRMEYTAMGDAINLAARMEQTARPGTVQISEETYKLVEPIFEFEALGKVEVKGKADPIPTYRPLQLKMTPGRLRGITNLESPLIGRHDERIRIQKALDALEKGVGGLVMITGEAGIGKSRLLLEMQSTRSKNHTWYETVSLSYETGQPYALFQRLLRRIVNATADEKPENLITKSRQFLQEQEFSKKEQILQVMTALFGAQRLDDSPGLSGETFKGLLYTVMHDFFQQLAAKPIVLVCDDLHWSDPASIELLEHLLPLTQSVSLLFVLMMRPERESPGWKLKETAADRLAHSYMEIRLRPLKETESRELVDSLLNISDLPDRLRDRIQEKTEGNPFFVEEVIRTLIDSGMVVHDEDGTHWRATSKKADFEMPGNLQTLLVTRIDNLEADEKQTLQTASVVGRAFYHRILRSLADIPEEKLDAQLIALQRSRMIIEAARFPEKEYLFRHALTQEAAYSTILRKQRHELHRKVGLVIEQVFPERREELAGTLADHFSQSGDFDRALKYYTIAGDLAYRLFASVEAIDYYRLALYAAEKTEIDSAALRHLYTRLGRAYELTTQYDNAHKVYTHEMPAAAAGRNDEALRLAALQAVGVVYGAQTPRHDPEKAHTIAAEALQLAQKLKDPAAEARVYWIMLLAEVFGNGDPTKALDYGLRSLKLAEEHNLKEQIGFTHTNLSNAYNTLNMIQEARQSNLAALAVWQELDNMPMQLDASMPVIFSSMNSGQFDEAEKRVEEGMRIAKAIGNQWFQLAGPDYIFRIRLQRGDTSEAQRILEQEIARYSNIEFPMKDHVMSRFTFNQLLIPLTLNITENTDIFVNRILENWDFTYPIWRPAIFAVLMQAKINEDLFEDAYKMREEAIKDHGIPENYSPYSLPFFVIEPAILIGLGKPTQALAVCEALVPKLRADGFNIALTEVLWYQGRALAALGEHQRAEVSLSEALALSEKTGERKLRWKILSSLAAVHTALDQNDKAGQFISYARDEVLYIQAHANEEMAEMFISLPAVRQILN